MRAWTRRRRRPRYLRRSRLVTQGLAITVGALAMAWLLGFLWFAGCVAMEEPVVPMPHADGIVVLTGGRDRVKLGLELLVAGAAPRLLISGAGAGTNLGDFTPRDGINAVADAPRITIGHDAATTRGNALEAAAWASRYHLHSLIIVTANYHMPRALLEFRRHLPGIRLKPEPVLWIRPLDSWQMLRLLVTEYIKYLTVRVGLGGFAARNIRIYM